jgi:hypothetical protein
VGRLGFFSAFIDERGDNDRLKIMALAIHAARVAILIAAFVPRASCRRCSHPNSRSPSSS